MPDAKKPLTPEEQSKADETQLKKLLESYTAVAKHKLGRTPTLEDLTKMLTPENQGQEDLGAHQTQTPVTAKPVGKRSLDRATETQPAQGTVAPHTDTSEPLKKDDESEGEEGLPTVARMKVYYGMGSAGADGTKKPDPGKILFYETHDGRFFDTGKQEWELGRPTMADHLPCRPIEQHEKDVVAAIAHGVMDDESYNALDKAEMIGDTPRRLWSAMQRLKTLHGDLEKSTDMPDTDDDVSVDPDLLPGAPSQGSGVDLLHEFQDTAGVAGMTREDAPQEPGQDLIRQIMEAALSAIDDDLEPKIVGIVRRELAKFGLTSAGDDEGSIEGQDDAEAGTEELG